jgi:hypothetical protein
MFTELARLTVQDADVAPPHSVETEAWKYVVVVIGWVVSMFDVSPGIGVNVKPFVEINQVISPGVPEYNKIAEPPEHTELDDSASITAVGPLLTVTGPTAVPVATGEVETILKR